jgi:hypothetical protein
MATWDSFRGRRGKEFVEESDSSGAKAPGFGEFYDLKVRRPKEGVKRLNAERERGAVLTSRTSFGMTWIFGGGEPRSTTGPPLRWG